MYKKTAVITGAAGLLGIQHASALLESGYNVILLDLKKNLLKKINLKLIKLHKDKIILSYPCDITQEKKVKDILNKIKKKKLKVEVLVNNADKNPKMNKYTKSYAGRVEDYSINDLKKQLDVGVVGTFICSKIFGMEMKKNKVGSIINISSDLGINAPDQRVYEKNEKIEKVKNFKPIGYSISKHAIHGITKYLSTYWAKDKIRCNTLVLGAVLNNQPKFLIKNVQKRIPLNRWAKVDEYKKAVQFLAGSGSRYMTGQSLIIDGGRTIW